MSTDKKVQLSIIRCGVDGKGQFVIICHLDFHWPVYEPESENPFFGTDGPPCTGHSHEIIGYCENPVVYKMIEDQYTKAMKAHNEMWAKIDAEMEETIAEDNWHRRTSRRF